MLQELIICGNSHEKEIFSGRGKPTVIRTPNKKNLIGIACVLKDFNGKNDLSSEFNLNILS